MGVEIPWNFCNDTIMNKTNNPYVNNLIEMGYDEQDVKVASTMFQKKTFPCVIHGRKFETEEQYYAELHEYMNGM
tara:strand:+ start:3384 stop:3608 length:225 start_codon:yes stop_codon:yes gene_type:complete